MKVFKFGGASLKTAAGIRNVASIIRQAAPANLLVVVSAIGKTTDALEKIHALAAAGKDFSAPLASIKDNHYNVMRELFAAQHPVFDEIEKAFFTLQQEALTRAPFDQVYDQVVSMGEILSSIVVHNYLRETGAASYWLDARTCIATDSSFREGKVNWPQTAVTIQKLKPVMADHIIITQGFIGRTDAGLTTTLGREGSDFSAAIFASSLDATSVTIVEGCSGCDERRPQAPARSHRIRGAAL